MPWSAEPHVSQLGMQVPNSWNVTIACDSNCGRMYRANVAGPAMVTPKQAVKHVAAKLIIDEGWKRNPGMGLKCPICSSGLLLN